MLNSNTEDQTAEIDSTSLDPIAAGCQIYWKGRPVLHRELTMLGLQEDCVLTQYSASNRIRATGIPRKRDTHLRQL